MNDDTTTYEAETVPGGMSSVPPPPVEPLSITDKFIGILTEPSATYGNVRAAGPRTSDWLVPVALTALVLLVGMFLRFSNPATMSQMMETQTKALQEQVDQGKMTAEQAEQATQQMESMGGIFKVIGAVSAGFGFVIVFFILCLFYWLVVRFVMKGDVNFGLILSAAGLSAFISVIDQLVSLLLVFVTDKAFANLSPNLFMGGDMATTSDRLLMMLNPIAIWSYYVLGIGFEKVAAISRTKGMITAFGFFILASLAGAFMGFGM